MSTPEASAAAASAIETRRLSLWYGDFQALKEVSLSLRQGIITSLIGPSGCGKTTLLRCFNRINERYGNVRTSGEVRILGENIYAPEVSLIELRKGVGMVFQRPNPLPISIYENVVFGLRVHTPRSELSKQLLDEAVEKALGEVRPLDGPQGPPRGPPRPRCCSSSSRSSAWRACLPLKPEVILMDEPASALDVEGTRAIEELMAELRGRYTIVIVTHNMAQARRASDECLFMLLGEVVEHTRTEDLFLNPRDPRTAEYIEGRYA